MSCAGSKLVNARNKLNKESPRCESKLTGILDSNEWQVRY